MICEYWREHDNKECAELTLCIKKTISILARTLSTRCNYTVNFVKLATVDCETIMQLVSAYMTTLPFTLHVVATTNYIMVNKK